MSGSIHGGGDEASDGHIGGARIEWTDDAVSGGGSR